MGIGIDIGIEILGNKTLSSCTRRDQCNVFACMCLPLCLPQCLPLPLPLPLYLYLRLFLHLPLHLCLPQPFCCKCD